MISWGHASALFRKRTERKYKSSYLGFAVIRDIKREHWDVKGYHISGQYSNFTPRENLSLSSVFRGYKWEHWLEMAENIKHCKIKNLIYSGIVLYQRLFKNIVQSIQAIVWVVQILDLTKITTSSMIQIHFCQVLFP